MVTEYTVWVKKKSPPEVFWHFFPNGWEFLNNFLHTYYMFLSTLDYKFLFNYLQLWLSYAILSVTTHFTSYAQCPSSAETHAFRCLWKLLIALLIVVCGKSSQICCSALFSSLMVFGFDWSLWNAWSIAPHNCVNSKLFAIYQTVGSVHNKGLSRHESVIINRLRIGHTRLTHSYLLLSDDQPTCSTCGHPLTVRHILLHCVDLQNVRRRHFSVTCLRDLFQTVDNCTVIDFIKEIRFYSLL